MLEIREESSTHLAGKAELGDEEADMILFFQYIKSPYMEYHQITTSSRTFRHEAIWLSKREESTTSSASK
jgi:hypothetical protein